MHSRDKRKWFAANFGRQYFESAPLQLPYVALGLLVPVLLVAVIMCIGMDHSVASGMLLAGMPVIPAINIKQLRQTNTDLSTEAKALLARAQTEGMDAVREQYGAVKAKLKANAELLQEAETFIEQDRASERDATLARTASGRIEVGSEGFEHDPKGGFMDHRAFLKAVMDVGSGRSMDPRLARFRATQGSDEQQSGSDPYGGFLVPSGIAPGVMMTRPDDIPFASTPIPMNVPSLYVNARVDKDHSSSVSGGLTVTRKPETANADPSRTQFEQIHMVAHDLFGLAYASESLLQDSPQSFVAILQAGFQDEFASNRMNEILNGTGAGEFLGIMKSKALITVSKQGSQTADTIVKENIDKMIARSWRYMRAVWLANQTTIPQLRGLFQLVGTTGGAPVAYFNDGSNGGVQTLCNRPIYFTEYCAALGDLGDIMLVIPSEFLEGTYQPMQQAESIHVRFIAHERCFKFWLRNDGKPWWTSALTPKNGDTLSPFVTLQAR
jgi:HK97 family phage major capsid protein